MVATCTRVEMSQVPCSCEGILLAEHQVVHVPSTAETDDETTAFAQGNAPVTAPYRLPRALSSNNATCVKITPVFSSASMDTCIAPPSGEASVARRSPPFQRLSIDPREALRPSMRESDLRPPNRDWGRHANNSKEMSNGRSIEWETKSYEPRSSEIRYANLVRHHSPRHAASPRHALSQNSMDVGTGSPSVVGQQTGFS